MSLGGYKFVGKYCQRNSLSDTQWILLMHKTKVAAFMEANSLATAGWDYHMTGSPDGNFHCLDSVGNNYVTCFYNQTADRYFAIYTLCNHTNSGTDSGMVQVYLSRHLGFVKNGSSTYYVGVYASNFIRMGQVEIAYNTPLNIDLASSYISRLIPVGNLGLKTSDEGSSGYGKTNTLFAESSVMFGYAVKNDSILMFSGKYVTGQISTYLGMSVVSGHAFTDLFGGSADDGTVYLYNSQSTSSSTSYTYENAARLAEVESLFSPVSQCCMYNGTPTNTTPFSCLPIARYNTQPTDIPYQSIYLTDLTTGTAVIAKGAIKIDLLAMNFPGHQNGLCPALYSTVANGNYLCIRYTGSSSTSYNYGINFQQGFNTNPAYSLKLDAALYVGWDSSNPDITLDSSWSLYTGT